MQDKVIISKFHHRAKIVRKIAEGIFDKTERETLLNFVEDCEKLAAPSSKKPT